MSGHKIMVVDDNSATRRMVRNALSRKGHDVLEAPDGKTARELMQREHPRVILQDLMLPDADGFALVGELRSLAGGTDVSILAFSGFVSAIDEARVSKVGFDDIIPKPIAPSRLVPLVEAHLPNAVPVAAPFGGGRRLILADDDPMQLKLAQFRLSRMGFAVEPVLDGRAAIEAMRRELPAAVVADVMMPGLDGFGLAMAIRRDPQLHRVPLVLLTASYVEAADRELARRAGADDLVPKAPELTELVGALRTALQTSPAPASEPADLDALEREHAQRVLRQLERQVSLNTGLAKRCSALASELAVLAGISEAVLEHQDVDLALDEALGECFDAGGIALGALYLVGVDPHLTDLRVRPVGPGSDQVDLASLFGHVGLLHDLIREGKTLYLPSADLPRNVERSLLQHANASALLMVPLLRFGVPLGSLLMIARGRELDREDWLSFAHGVATQITHVLTLARAYADREQAERRATEHAALLDAIMNNAPDFVTRVDLEGRILFMNRVTNPYWTDGAIGTSLFDYPPSDHQASLRAAFEQLKSTGEPQGFEASMFRGGTHVWLSTRLGPVIEHGRLTGAVLVSRDVSDKKQTEVHLVLADRMASVGTLAAGVAHEINNPLASVIANLDMAMQDVSQLGETVELPAELVDELKDARTASDRVREIVRDLKIFSRAEEDSHGPVDVENVLDSTLRMAWNEIRHRAKLVKAYGHPPNVDVNESRLGQVFLNLIVNAAHAIAPGNYETNQIRVSTSVDSAGRIVVAIADTGAGIPPEVRPRLFTPFFTTKPVGVGTGLGLAISLRIVQQCGGAIAYDTAVGRGTEFRVTLPAAGDAQPKPKRISSLTLAVRRATILVIDDEEVLAQAIKRYLSVDHDVTAVSRAGEALVLLERGTRYDVILCDLMMPQITGMQLHAEVMKLDPDQAARIVFLTGGAFTAQAREFLDQTPNVRLEKPFELKKLKRLINDLLGG